MWPTARADAKLATEPALSQWCSQPGTADLIHRRCRNLKDLREALAEAETCRDIFREVAILEVGHESALFLLARVRQANVRLARVHRELQGRRVLDLVRVASHVPG